MQRSRRRSRTPPGQGTGFGPTHIIPIVRKRLRDMTAAERQGWLAAQQAELEDFATYAQSYLKGREASGRQTQTDDRYHQFLERAADLIAGLAEMREELADQKEEEPNP